MTEHPFIEIIELIKKARSKAFSSVNTELINLYWHIGEYIHKRLENSEWGEKKVNELADFIKSYYPELKGFNRRSTPIFLATLEDTCLICSFQFRCSSM